MNHPATSVIVGRVIPLDRRALALDDIARRLDDLSRQVAELAVHQETVNAIMITLAARITDPVHVSVAEAARILRVSEKTVRRQIRPGGFTLETIPGMNRKGIPLEQIYGRWIDWRVARKAVTR